MLQKLSFVLALHIAPDLCLELVSCRAVIPKLRRNHDGGNFNRSECIGNVH